MNGHVSAECMLAIIKEGEIESFSVKRIEK